MAKTTRRNLVLVLIVAFPSPSPAGDGIVALQTADPSCADDSGNTYVNCGNGTVTDNRTGLVWLRNANCLETLDWGDAMDLVAGLSDIPPESAVADRDCGLSDGSSPGEWRLPSVSEFEAMALDARVLGCHPSITDDQGDGCWASTLECVLQGRTCSFSGVRSSSYWSSSVGLPDPTLAFFLSMENGTIGSTYRDTSDLIYVWPVRGGQ